MKLPAYILSEGAEEDLRSITRYTLKNHGHKQTLKYRDQLETCTDNLANDIYPHKVIADIIPEICYLQCQYHYIFGLRQIKKPMIVIAILHERMDLMRRVADRINNL